jgi:hypothetical protein
MANRLERILAMDEAMKARNAPKAGMQKVVNADGTVTEIPYMEDRRGRRTVMTASGPKVMRGFEGKNLPGEGVGKAVRNVLGGLFGKGGVSGGTPPFVPAKEDYFDMSGVGQKKAVGELITAPNQTSVYQNTFPDGRVTWQDPNTGTIIFDSATMGALPANAGGQPPSTSNRSGVFKPPPKELTPDQQTAERIHGDPNVTVDGRVVNGVKTRKMTSAEYLAALRKKGEAGREGPEAKLRGEYTKNTDEFSKIDSAFSRLQSSLNGTGAGDLSLVFQYMKILDPGSTVREGEFANAANAGGVDDQIVGIYNKIREGAFLSPMQRIDFYQRAKDLYNSAAERYDYTTEMFTNLANAYEITGDNINKVIYRRDSQRNTGSKLSNLLDGLTLEQLVAFDPNELLQKGGQLLLDEVADYIEKRKQGT